MGYNKQPRPVFSIPVNEAGAIEAISQSEIEMFVRQTRRPYELHIRHLQEGWAGAYAALCDIASAIDGATPQRDTVDLEDMMKRIMSLQKAALGHVEKPQEPTCGSVLTVPGRQHICNKGERHIINGDIWHEDARGNRWELSSPAPKLSIDNGTMS